MVVKASMILLAAFSLAPALVASSAASLEPVLAINMRDNNFASISSVKLDANCKYHPHSNPNTIFGVDPFHRGAPEWCAEMKDDLRKISAARQVRVANMLAINGENIEHDVEREFDITVETTDKAGYVKNGESMYGICVR